MRKKVNNYTDEFKKQIVALNKNGKTIVELAEEYELAKSTVRKRCMDYEKTGSFKAVDNRSEMENKQLRLEKENKQLKMEVGENKDSKLVYQAFMNSKINLSKVKIFHTDRGSEFKNMDRL